MINLFLIDAVDIQKPTGLAAGCEYSRGQANWLKTAQLTMVQALGVDRRYTTGDQLMIPAM